VVTRRADFQQQRIILLQGQLLADHRGEPEVLTILDIGTLLFAVVFISQHGGDRGGAVGPRIPRGAALELLRPVAQLNVARHRHRQVASGICRRLGAVFADRYVEAVRR